MKTTLALLLIAFCFSGCASAGKVAKQLKDDPAIIVLRLGTPWGTQHLTRIGGTTNAVSIATDGTVIINPPK